MCKPIFRLIVSILVLCLGTMGLCKSLYLDNFDGEAGMSLNGTTPDVTQDDAMWEAGANIGADGALGSLFTAVLPFVPKSGNVYEIVMNMENEGDWGAIGFFTEITNLDTRFMDNAPVFWALTRQSGAVNNDQAFVGPSTQGALGDADTSHASELIIRLDTTNESEWVVTWIFDGSEAFQEAANPADYDIQYVGFGVNGMFSVVSGSILRFEFRDNVSDTQAWTPSPQDGEVDVLRDVELTWRPGEFAGAHDVYLGKNFDDVNEASRAAPGDLLVSQGQAETTYTSSKFLPR